MKKVVVFGVFDRLHPGHLYFLREAKKRGDHLTVVVSRDARAMHEKKHKPVFNERERLTMVAALKGVDRAVLGEQAGQWNILKTLKPDIICVGYDQTQLPHLSNKSRTSVCIIRIKSFHPAKYKSSQYARH